MPRTALAAGVAVAGFFSLSYSIKKKLQIFTFDAVKFICLVFFFWWGYLNFSTFVAHSSFNTMAEEKEGCNKLSHLG